MTRTLPGWLLLVAVLFSAVPPAAAQVEEVRLDIAGYLCGF